MGIFSDTLETNRESWRYDPCMISPAPRFDTSMYYRDLDAYRMYTEDAILQREKRETLLHSLSTIEATIRSSLMIKDLLLEYLSQRKVASPFMDELFHRYLAQMEETNQEVTKLREDIMQALQPCQTNAVPVETEAELKREMVNVVLDSFFYQMQQGIKGAFFDKNPFGKAVLECGIFLRYMLPPQEETVPKLLVQRLLRERKNLCISHVICENCKEPLLEDVEYCFNCNYNCNFED